MLMPLMLSLALAITGGGAVRDAVQDAESLGYAPCHPQVVDAEEGWARLGFGEMPEDVGAWAAWPEAHGACEVGLTPWALDNGHENLTWVARHEVCHLSVGVQIDVNPANAGLADRHHEAHDFVECMERMTALPAPAPVLPEADPSPGGLTDSELAAEEAESTTDNGQDTSPRCPDAGNGWCTFPDAVVLDTRTGATTEARNLLPDTDPAYTDQLCADLQEVKPWIPC